MSDYSVHVDADGDLVAQDGSVLRAATAAEIEEAVLTPEGCIEVPADCDGHLAVVGGFTTGLRLSATAAELERFRAAWAAAAAATAAAWAARIAALNAADAARAADAIAAAADARAAAARATAGRAAARTLAAARAARAAAARAARAAAARAARAAAADALADATDLAAVR